MIYSYIIFSLISFIFFIIIFKSIYIKNYFININVEILLYLFLLSFLPFGKLNILLYLIYLKKREYKFNFNLYNSKIFNFIKNIKKWIYLKI